MHLLFYTTFSPQILQYLASSSTSSLPHLEQTNSKFWRLLRISAVTIPVGTAMIEYPESINKIDKNFPKGVTGETSPYPTVVIVTTAQ